MQARPNTSQSHDLHARDRVDLAGLSESARIAGAGAPCIEGMRCHVAEDFSFGKECMDETWNSGSRGVRYAVRLPLKISGCLFFPRR
jgi:hypothetical protein